MPKLFLSNEVRERLKAPIGTLLTGSPQETIAQLKKNIETERPPMIICVGDFVSKNLKSADIHVDVSVVDNKIMRRDTEPWQESGKIIFRANNAPGTIDPIAWQALREAVEKKNSLLLIEGEEDLLALPAVLLAPDRALVIYGQPKEGVVVVTVDSGKKAEIQNIINGMISRDR